MTNFKQRFLCDEMLIRLARWLRAAGYDTEMVAHSVNDRDLMAFAQANDRLILTRDRKFLERRGADERVLIIISGAVDEQAQEIAGPLCIDWLRAPFSRCLMDNTPLRPASEEEIDTLPWPRQNMSETVMTCPKCGRHYWSGSHTRRMLAKLKAWTRGSFNATKETL